MVSECIKIIKTYLNVFLLVCLVVNVSSISCLGFQMCLPFLSLINKITIHSMMFFEILIHSGYNNTASHISGSKIIFTLLSSTYWPDNL